MPTTYLIAESQRHESSLHKRDHLCKVGLRHTARRIENNSNVYCTTGKGGCSVDLGGGGGGDGGSGGRCGGLTLSTNQLVSHLTVGWPFGTIAVALAAVKVLAVRAGRARQVVLRRLARET